MKTIILLLSMNLAFAQTPEAEKAEFKSILAAASSKTLDCTELKVEHDSRKVAYTISLERGYDYDDEFYVRFTETPTVSWTFMVAYEDYMDRPLGELEKTVVDEKTSVYKQTFFGRDLGTLNLKTVEGIAKSLHYEEKTETGYRVMILDCQW